MPEKINPFFQIWGNDFLILQFSQRKSIIIKFLRDFNESRLKGKAYLHKK